jgi:hypothetical protein
LETFHFDLSGFEEPLKPKSMRSNKRFGWQNEAVKEEECTAQESQEAEIIDEQPENENIEIDEGSADQVKPLEIEDYVEDNSSQMQADALKQKIFSMVMSKILPRLRDCIHPQVWHSVE